MNVFFVVAHNLGGALFGQITDWLWSLFCIQVTSIIAFYYVCIFGSEVSDLVYIYMIYRCS